MRRDLPWPGRAPWQAGRKNGCGRAGKRFQEIGKKISGERKIVRLRKTNRFPGIPRDIFLWRFASGKRFFIVLLYDRPAEGGTRERERRDRTVPGDAGPTGLSRGFWRFGEKAARRLSRKLAGVPGETEGARRSGMAN